MIPVPYSYVDLNIHEPDITKTSGFQKVWKQLQDDYNEGKEASYFRFSQRQYTNALRGFQVTENHNACAQHIEVTIR